MKWWASDQPGYIPLAVNPATGAAEPNYKQCVGFVGFPTASDCDAKFPTNARVCRCTANVPPAPSPGPAATTVTYSTLVWAYVWDNTAAPAETTADVGPLS